MNISVANDGNKSGEEIDDALKFFDWLIESSIFIIDYQSDIF